jgi:hypothetical protein
MKSVVNREIKGDVSVRAASDLFRIPNTTLGKSV